VQAAFPDIECLQFNGKNASATLDLLVRLRDLFGKSRPSEEDAIRLQSLRQNAAFVAEQSSGAGHTERFLAGLDAELRFDFAKDAADTRTLELMNKTNQFNLNGQRLDEAVWRQFLQEADTFLITISYT